MSATRTAPNILDRQYLEMRCGLLDLAAAFDRISRAPEAGTVEADPRYEKLQKAIQIVASNGSNRAEQLQLLFSDEYLPGWNKS